MIRAEDFVDDAPWRADPEELSEVWIDNQIHGVELRRILRRSDRRGSLEVLLSDRHGAEFTTPHVYPVTAAARSVRAWVCHKRQSDRLAYTSGRLRVVLFDLRPDSPTHGGLNVIDVGGGNCVLLTIPPFVAHGVQNLGDEDAQFVNLPTRAYDPTLPDKSRLPRDHPGIPYRFE